VKSVDDKDVLPNYYIREDTITHPKQEEKVQDALQKTIYGTDGSKDNEIANAYSNGYRDFDCAYSYHNGESYLFFRKFEIREEDPVRIVYKFKFEEVKEASIELSKLFRTPGVVIYTIMLHEVPEQSQDIDFVLHYLASLGKTYQCRIGVSNISLNETDPANIDTIRQSLRGDGIDISIIENRMNPSIPDKALDDYCQTNGIQYIAYGLTGPSQAGGTCGMETSVGNGDYMILQDLALIKLANQEKISPEELRYLIYSWARSKKNISIIARSSQPARQSENKTDMENMKIFEFLYKLNEIDTESGLLYPFYKYLISEEISIEKISQLKDKISTEWLNLYYRKAMVDQKDEFLITILKNQGLLDKIEQKTPKDLTGLRKYFLQILESDIIAPVTFPKNPTNEKLVAFINDSSIDILNEDYDVIEKDKLKNIAVDKIILYQQQTQTQVQYKKMIDYWEGPLSLN
jgi:diketogulonate reductase-like aldo/keto reductase